MEMRLLRTLICGLALACSFSAGGQDQGQPEKANSLYAKALFASLSEMDKQWSRYSKGDETTARTDYHHMFVEADPQITSLLPSESASYRVEYLDSKGQVARYKQLGKEFPLLKIHPMHDEGDHLKITVSVYYFSYKKRHATYGLSDWSDVEMRFDCEKQQFVISSVKLGGI